MATRSSLFALWAAGGLACAFLSACFDVDLDFRHHNCPFTYDYGWQSSDLKLDHNDTRKCPIPVHSVGEDIMFAAGVVDPNEGDVTPGTEITLAIYSSHGALAGYRSATWFDDGFDNRAYASTFYDAALGYVATGNPDDQAVLSTLLVNSDPVKAYITLQSLFGTRNTSVVSPSSSVNPPRLPVDQVCPFSAQSTLNGQVRTNMLHEWYVDGEHRGNGDNAQLYIVAEGPHSVQVRAIDSHGYETWSPATTVISDPNVLTCP